MILDNVKNFFKLVRWFHELLAIFPFVTLYFIIEYYIQKTGLTCNLSGVNFILLCICVQLLIAAGCILNDIMDREIDKINKPNTHIIGRAISLINAKRLFVVTTLLIIFLSVYISFYVFKEWAFISTAVYLLSVLYDVYLKKSPLLGNILIAFLASFIPLVLFFFAKDCIYILHNEKLNILIYIYAIFPFLIIVPRELSLDISDIEGDKALGCKTLPILIGVKKAKLAVAALIVLIIISSMLLMYKYTYLLPTCLFIDVLLFFYLFQLKKAEQRIEYIRAGRFLWFIMIIGHIGFAIFTVY
jgi:4-hydroxybenzoate polyprenyltransferase